MIKRILNIRSHLKKRRFEYIVRKSASHCGTGLHVNGKSIVNEKTILGNNVNFNGMTVIGNGPVTIGDNFHSGIGCTIITENHDYDKGERIPYSAIRSIELPVVIEDNVWLGGCVTVLPGVRIGEGAVIQAGSVVVYDIDKYSVAGGHPARTFKMRDIEHYQELKAKKLFF